MLTSAPHQYGFYCLLLILRKLCFVAISKEMSKCLELNSAKRAITAFPFKAFFDVSILEDIDPCFIVSIELFY